MIRILLLAAASIAELVKQTADTGRVVTCAESPSERVSGTVLLAPGAPPVLSFKTFDATERGRLSEMGLMTDDAGH